MSDPVLVALLSSCIAGVPAALAAVASLITAMKVERQNSHISETREKIAELEKNTNSMKDMLVKVTGESEYAKGASGKAPGFPIPADPTASGLKPRGWWYYFEVK